MSYRIVGLLLIGLTTGGLTTGCQDRMADQLLGRWVGQPDSSAKQAKREALRYQDLTGLPKTGLLKTGPLKTGPVKTKEHSIEFQQPAESQHDLLTETPNQSSLLSAGATDWEQYDVQIFLEFEHSQQVSMSLANEAEPRSGSWRVVRETPMGLVIEIETSRNEPSGSQEMSGQGEVSTERRRFELQLTLDDRSENGQSCLGFRLIELGADPRLGAIYFQREKEK
jgi:hypothetical protein